MELVLIWHIFDMYTSSYIVQVLLKVILQGFKVEKLTITTQRKFAAAVAVASTAIFAAATVFEKWFLKFRKFHF